MTRREVIVFAAAARKPATISGALTRSISCVVELADALDSKSSTRKGVWVRSPPPAPLPLLLILLLLLIPIHSQSSKD